MNSTLIFASIWVLAASGVAMLSMRWQFRLVPILFVFAVVLMGLIAKSYGWVAFVAVLIAFVSMFRHPLRYVWRRLRGENPEIPQ